MAAILRSGAHRRLGALLASVSVALGCVTREVTQVAVEAATREVREAQQLGAARCAPRLLAIAESELLFAKLELRQGDYDRVSRHAERARLHGTAASLVTRSSECDPGRTDTPKR